MSEIELPTTLILRDIGEGQVWFNVVMGRLSNPTKTYTVEEAFADADAVINAGRTRSPNVQIPGASGRGH